MSGFKSFDTAAMDAGFEKALEKPKYASDATVKLPDGDYEVQITTGLLKDGEYGPIVTILMTVLGDGPQRGWQVEKTYFLTKKGEGDSGRIMDERKIGELKSDLSTMGFDVANWTAANNRPFSVQLDIAASVMKGMKLKVRKKQNDEYANIYVNKRLEDGKPAKLTAADMVKPPPGANEFGQSPLGDSIGAPTGAPGGGSNDPIPF